MSAATAILQSEACGAANEVLHAYLQVDTLDKWIDANKYTLVGLFNSFVKFYLRATLALHERFGITRYTFPDQRNEPPTEPRTPSVQLRTPNLSASPQPLFGVLNSRPISEDGVLRQADSATRQVVFSPQEFKMNFDLPTDLTAFISRIDAFIKAKILPLQHSNDNNRFFDHRRESSRTQWDNGGLPTDDWEKLLVQARKLADEAGFFRFPMPKEFGGQEHPNLNLYMCAIRFHLSSHPVYGGGVSLANDLQNEHSVVGNFPDILMLYHFGTEEQRKKYIPARLRGEFRTTFGLTEIHHGSDATHMDTTARPIKLDNGEAGYEINGNKKWQTGMHHATHMLIFARTSGKDGSAKGITAFIVPKETPGIDVLSYEWTLNMPTDHATVALKNVRVPASAILGPVDNGLAIAQTFTHENRIRQASSSCGAAKFCIDRSVKYANSRKVFGRVLSGNQAIQWPLVELATQVEMLRLLILRTAWEMDNVTQACLKEGKSPWVGIEQQLGHKIGMCNYYANRLATEAADRAIQVHGGNGYSRHEPFEHIWRHFRRYRITEGSEEVQMRKVAAYLFGYKTTGAGGESKSTQEEIGKAESKL